ARSMSGNSALAQRGHYAHLVYTASESLVTENDADGTSSRTDLCGVGSRHGAGWTASREVSPLPAGAASGVIADESGSLCYARPLWGTWKLRMRADGRDLRIGAGLGWW